MQSSFDEFSGWYDKLIGDFVRVSADIISCGHGLITVYHP